MYFAHKVMYLLSSTCDYNPAGTNIDFESMIRKIMDRISASPFAIFSLFLIKAKIFMMDVEGKQSLIRYLQTLINVFSFVLNYEKIIDPFCTQILLF